MHKEKDLRRQRKELIPLTDQYHHLVPSSKAKGCVYHKQQSWWENKQQIAAAYIDHGEHLFELVGFPAEDFWHHKTQ